MLASVLVSVLSFIGDLSVIDSLVCVDHYVVSFEAITEVVEFLR